VEILKLLNHSFTYRTLVRHCTDRNKFKTGLKNTRTRSIALNKAQTIKT